MRGHIAVTGSDGRGDEVMLPGGHREPFRFISREAADAHQVGAYGAQRRRQVAVRRRAVERWVEPSYEVVVPVDVRGGVDRVEPLGESVEYRCGRAPGRERGGGGLQAVTDLEELPDIFRVDRGDDGHPRGLLDH